MPRLTFTKWFSLLLCYGLAASSWAAQTNVIEGSWIGGFEDGKDWIYLQAHFKSDGAKLTGTFDRPLEFVMGAELNGVVLQSPRIQFEIEKPQRLRFDGKMKDGAMDGQVAGAGKALSFHLTRITNINVGMFAGIYRVGKDHVITLRPTAETGLNGFALTDFKTAESRALFPLDGETFFCGDKLLVTHPINSTFQFAGEVSGPMHLTWKRTGSALSRGTRVTFAREEIAFTNGDVRLGGTLSFPDTRGPHPAIVFIHGSGPGGRDELRFIADYFLVNGFATVVYGKRTNWTASSFSDLADDALAAVRVLKSRADIRQAGLWGVSQGGWLVALAASRSSDVAFIINESGPGITPEAQMQFWVRTKLRGAGFDNAAMLAASNLVRKNFDCVRTDSGWDALAQANDAARRAPWFTHMASLEMHRDDPAFWKLNAGFDPVPVLRKVRCPVLALYGARDTLVPPRESADIWRTALKQAGNSDVTVKVFPDGDHGLRETTGGTLKDLSRSRGFVSGYFETQRTWALKRVPLQQR
jgi:pimeloyl-ACP methyl ester carboxylesterase